MTYMGEDEFRKKVSGRDGVPGTDTAGSQKVLKEFKITRQSFVP